MRPPSYYTSIAQGNDRSRNSAAYLSSSSQQLRSSLSSSTPSSYVNRTHLPYVPQSTLVAHCFTGVGSSTRPYTSGTYSSSYSSSPASSTSARLSSSLGHSHLAASSTRPLSKRSASPYTPSTSSAYLPPRSPYLTTGSSSALSSASRYRPIVSSSYYKPIRLRERPLLTQLSSRISSSSSSPIGASSSASRHSSRKDSSAPQAEDSKQAKKLEGDENDDWSRDVARNISRNKYLIKFREFDKSKPRESICSPIEQLVEDKGLDWEERKETVGMKVEANIGPPNRLLEQDQQVESLGAKIVEAKKGEASSISESIIDCDTPTKATPTTADQSVKKRVKKVKKRGSDAARIEPGETKDQLEGAKVEDATDKQERPVAKEEGPPSKSEPAASAAERQEAPTKERQKVKLRLRPIGAAKAGAAPSKPEPKDASPKQADEEERKVLPAAEQSCSAPAPQAATAAAEAATPPKVKVKQLVKKGSKAKLKVKGSGETTPCGDQDKENEAGAEKPKQRLKVRRKASDAMKVDTELASLVKGKAAATKPTVASQESRAAAGALLSPAQGAELASSALGPSTTNGTPPVAPKSTRLRFREYNYNDFNFLAVLGHGGWGFVILAELKTYDACFAVKCIKKITIVEDDDYESIMIERKMLALGNVNPFICKLFCTFETDGYLFFVMEYCPGGDLMFHVQREGKFTEPRSRFYAAEIICAIRFLHNRHIIYRDLKLDNILLDSRGHIRLVDFGMCQCRTYREEMLPSNFCGTPEYISPEIIKGVPYNHSVDWWSFGVLLYEMAVGKMPFRGNDENELLWNVCYEQIHYPMFLTQELTNLLKLLLEREPAKRMGMATCKSGDIYDQPFFRGVNWKAVEELKVEPPFVPEVNSKRDVQNFDSDFTESACELSPVDEKTLAKIDQQQFQKFPYTNPDIFMFESK